MEVDTNESDVFEETNYYASIQFNQVIGDNLILYSKENDIEPVIATFHDNS